VLDHGIQDGQGYPLDLLLGVALIRVSRLSIRVVILALASYGYSLLT
jgi:hypothetical protein